MVVYICTHVCTYTLISRMCYVRTLFVIPGVLTSMQRAVKDYCVRIAEDDGEIDQDLPRKSSYSSCTVCNVCTYVMCVCVLYVSTHHIVCITLCNTTV